MIGITGVHSYTEDTVYNLKNITKNSTFTVIHDSCSGIGYGDSLHKNDASFDKYFVFKALNRYSLILHGEIFNLPYLEQKLQKEGYTLNSKSAASILTILLVNKGVLNTLQELNGSFIFAFYDGVTNILIIVRDRYGEKPLYYHHNNNRIVFASDMKTILQYDIERKINKSSMFSYFAHNYIAGNSSIIQGVEKLPQGHYLTSQNGKIEIKKWYSLPLGNDNNISYKNAEEHLCYLTDKAVKLRLNTESPLGCFLSGGIDSSVITAVASRHKSDLQTFSIGFPENSYYDETHWAEIVAKHLNVNHHSFQIKKKEIVESLHNTLSAIDEPFADSSAILINILSKSVKNYISVALSGDGADEIFGGYRKHLAHQKAIQYKNLKWAACLTYPFLKLLPQSRTTPVTDKIRQLSRFAEGLAMTPAERYSRWAAICSVKEVEQLLKTKTPKTYIDYITALTSEITKNETVSNITKADIQMVLPCDMIPKVERMSAANDLLIRSPFLDSEIVEFALSLPDRYKVANNMRKRILQDSFRNLLPTELYNRDKKGFEIPLVDIMKNEMYEIMNNDLLSVQFIKEQNLFDYKIIENLKRLLFTTNIGDTPAKLWALVVFQNWYKKHIVD